MKSPVFAYLLAAVLSVPAADAQSTAQGQADTEDAWRARRARQVACASRGTVAPNAGAEARALNDSLARLDCRGLGFPALAAFVLTDHLICPSNTPWADPNPLALLSTDRIATIEVRRDESTKAMWKCPSPVDVIVVVTAKSRG